MNVRTRDVNKQIKLIRRKTCSWISCDFHVQTKLSVREKQSFLTMKIDDDSLLLLHDAGNPSDEEFLLLYDINNLTLPYWCYPKFDLDSLEKDECVSKFQLEKKDVYILGDTLEIPESIIWNQSRWNRVSLYIHKKIYLFMRVFGQNQSIRKTCARTLSCQ